MCNFMRMQVYGKASVQFRPHNRDLGMVVREVDEDLAIFLGIQNGEKEKNEYLVDDSDEFDGSTGATPNSDSLLPSNTLAPEKIQSTTDDNFINLEIDRTDYDWLLKQPDASSLPSVETTMQDSVATQNENSNGEDISLKSEPTSSPEKSVSLNNSLQPLAASTSVNSSAAANKKPLMSGGRKATPRSVTPTGRPSLPTKTKSSRPSTPTLKAKTPAAKPVAAQARSITPSRVASCTSTSVAKDSISVGSKSSSRSATPTRKPSNPSIKSSASPMNRSLSEGKIGPNMMKTPMLSLGGTFPSVKTRPSKPSDLLALSHDAPANSKILMPRRPASASRGRPSVPTTHLSNSKSRQKSCSPSRVRASNGTTAHKSGSMVLTKTQGHTNGGDEVNPVVMGTKMVERVINMRKLAPPKQDEYSSREYSRKTSQENSGFGRSLSKKSLDMAIRHMDIRRSINDNIRSVATGVLTPPSFGTQSGSADVSESSFATSSDSSEHTLCTKSHFLSGRKRES